MKPLLKMALDEAARLRSQGERDNALYLDLLSENERLWALLERALDRSEGDSGGDIAFRNDIRAALAFAGAWRTR